MTPKKVLPKKRKRFPMKVVQVVCGDCNALMERWDNPNDSREEHFETRCPECGMHIRHYEDTYLCIDTNGRAYMEVKWNKDLEWKKEFLQKEKNYWENQKRMRKEYDELERQLNEGIDTVDDTE